MNSWRSRRFWACAPPLITFSIGTGSAFPASPPIQRKSETPLCAAAAFDTASEQPRIAFAPRRLLFGVPSSSMRTRSSSRWPSASSPVTASAISLFTLPTAFSTPLPRKRLGSPSRSSTASCSPVDAPDGTAARPSAPDSRVTSTSTVGLPRESRISRAWTRVIADELIARPPSPGRSSDPARRAAAPRTRAPRRLRASPPPPRDRRSAGPCREAQARDRR